MKNFKQFVSNNDHYLTEAVTEGAKMEEIIVAAWNNKSIPKSTKISKNAGKNIVSFLKKQGVTGSKAYKLKTKGIEVTDEWSSFWLPDSVTGATKTPKTDIVIGDYAISLKTGPAQLMSGGKKEAKATFYAAAKKTTSVHSDKLAKEIYLKLNKLSELSLTKGGTVEQALKKNNDIVLKKADEINHEIKNMLGNLFNKNEEFKQIS